MSIRRTGRLAGAALSVVGAVLALASPAIADAPSAVPGSTQGTVTPNADGTRTVTVQGQWAWPSRTSDCNLSRAGAGFAVDWQDPAQPGNPVVTLGGTAVAVGVLSAGALNPADDLVHATAPATDSTSTALWRSGCGSFATPPGYNTGTWGPISHTYPASFTGAITLCPLFYDVQGSPSGGPSGSDQITAAGTNDNEDDSAEDNAATAQGNECPNTTLKSAPAIALSAPAGIVGSPSAAKGMVSGGYVPAGRLSFAVYAPGDTTCAAAPVYTGLATVAGNGMYTSPPFTPTGTGTYQWVASYAGDAANQPASTTCGSAPETAAPPASAASTSTQAPPSGVPAPVDLRRPPAGLGTLPLHPAVPAVRPLLGQTLALAPTAGTVLVSVPGSHRVRALGPGESVPVGTTIDARGGVVLLGSARDSSGDLQFATAGGGIFQVRQTRASGMTELVLKTPSVARLCAATAAHGAAVAARHAAPRSRRKVVNVLWSNDNHGQFSTRGQESVALVRGTSWVTAETCAGTLTGVMHGQVVVHDHRAHRVVVLEAGQSYLARR